MLPIALHLFCRLRRRARWTARALPALHLFCRLRRRARWTARALPALLALACKPATIASDSAPSADDTSPPAETADTAPDDTAPTDTSADDTAPEEVLRAVIAVDFEGGPLPLTVTFDASGSTAPLGLASAVWDFGDGDTEAIAPGETVARTWLGSGSYPVTLTITDETGASDVMEIAIAVEPGACPVSGAFESAGEIEGEQLDEVSGLATSAAYPGVLWAHNDSGDPPRFSAVSTSGELLGSWVLDHGEARDWEDMARYTSDAGSWLYLGDTGDNRKVRESIVIYRVPEPDPAGPPEAALKPPEDTGDTGGGGGPDQQTPPVFEGPHYDVKVYDTITLTYPVEPYDAEALMVDPVTEDIYLVSKNREGTGETHIHRKSAPHADGESATLEYIASLDFEAAPLEGSRVTAADISPLGDQILIRTNTTAYVFPRDGSHPLPAAFDGAPCAVEIPEEPQGETVAFAPDGAGFYSLSEDKNQPVWYVPWAGAL